MRASRRPRGGWLALVVLLLPVSAQAELASCGIGKRLCVTAETQSRRLSTADDGSRTRWVFPQLWTPWELALDPRGALTIRFRGGGANMLADGSIPPSTEWTEKSHQVTSCSGTVRSKKVVLHVQPAEDIQLLFDDYGRLVQVVDPGAIMPVRWPVYMVTVNRSYDSESQGKAYAWAEARNVTHACPAEAEAEGAAAAARDRFVQTLAQERAACDEGISEACRATAILLRHDGKAAEARQLLRRACALGSRAACDQMRSR